MTGTMPATVNPVCPIRLKIEPSVGCGWRFPAVSCASAIAATDYAYGQYVNGILCCFSVVLVFRFWASSPSAFVFLPRRGIVSFALRVTTRPIVPMPFAWMGTPSRSWYARNVNVLHFPQSMIPRYGSVTLAALRILWRLLLQVPCLSSGVSALSNRRFPYA